VTAAAAVVAVFRTHSRNVDVTVESQIGDLGLDSLDRLSAVMDLEEQLNLDIPDEAAEGSRTVGDAVEWVRGRVAA